MTPARGAGYAAVAPIDDLDARPGSATSLLRTLIGAALRTHGGWLPTATYVYLLDALDISADRARTALSRVKAKGLIVPAKRGEVAGYALAPAAEALLARGDRRIAEPRLMNDGDPWCLVSFTIPETARDRRHQLRNELGWIGAGTVAPALWIVPATLADEVTAIAERVGVARWVTLIVTDDLRTPEPLVDLVGRWWDLNGLRELHQRFLATVGAERAHTPAGDPSAAFAAWIRVLDAWRPIPYRDPGLPPALLPSDWPGGRSVTQYLELRSRLRAPADDFVAAVAASS